MGTRPFTTLELKLLFSFSPTIAFEYLFCYRLLHFLTSITYTVRIREQLRVDIRRCAAELLVLPFE